ncbi:MAG TPA: hypothetical protein VLL95_10755 [Phnomibacter sp.]|nr:hypothetical protein [Phnomibacter sp.]
MKQLEELLLSPRQMHHAQMMSAWVGISSKRFDALAALVYGDDPVLAQKAAWPMTYISEAHPEWIQKHLPDLLAATKKPGVHTAIVRSVVRSLQFVSIPQSLHGEVMDSCFRYIEDISEKPAVKAFALTVLHHLSKQYPDILPEIKEIVASRMDLETPAFRVRARVFCR